MSLNNRFQSGANKENTARILSHDVQTPAYVTPLAIVTKKARTLVKIALTGIMTINITPDSGVAGNNDAPFDGDEVEFVFSNGTGGALVVTFGTGFGTAGTLSVAAGKYGSAKFKFIGSANLFIEQSRALTA